MAATSNMTRRLVKTKPRPQITWRLKQTKERWERRSYKQEEEVLLELNRSHSPFSTEELNHILNTALGNDTPARNSVVSSIGARSYKDSIISLTSSVSTSSTISEVSEIIEDEELLMPVACSKSSEKAYRNLSIYQQLKNPLQFSRNKTNRANSAVLGDS